jgi:DNA-binding CsgD family transcriptional regulator
MARAVNPDDLTRSLLEAVGDQAALTRAIQGIGTSMNVAAFQAFVIGKANGAMVNTFAWAHDGIPDPAFDEYTTRLRALDPRFHIAMQRPEEVHSDVAVIAPDAFEKSELFNEMLGRHGIRYTLFGSFSLGEGEVFPIAFMRGKAAGAFQQDEVSFLGSLLPNLKHALRLHELIRRLADENRDLRAALDQVSRAIAVVGEGGRVRCANASASAILSKGDGLRTDRGVLAAANADDARQLARATACALAFARQHVSTRWHPSRVAIRRERGTPLELVLLPLTERSVCGPAGHVMVVIHDPDREVALDEALVAELHGLTATEAEIAVGLAAGRTITDIAHARGCTEQTARTHLKRIFSKMGLSRQSDLVRTLLTGPALGNRS